MLKNDLLSQGKSPSFADTTVNGGQRDSLKLIKSQNTPRNTGTAPGNLKSDTLNTNTRAITDTLNKRMESDTTAKKKVSMTLLDSLAMRSKDSTARMENFHYKRQDVPYVQLNPKKKSSFFANPSSQLVSRTVELDSTGNFVLIKEKIGNEPYKIMLRIPLDEYIKMKMEANNRNIWEDIAYKYELKDKTKDLGALITDITNIDIPLPSVGFLSIFGKKGINIRISGAVDIHGAWRNETTEGITASLLGNTRNEPDFKQTVQINVQGTIGDKLKINADWNTERTFEYENQLKLSYKGYEDEIVQSVEAGNVSLQTSPLVGGSEALFGVKANFQLGPLSLTTLASQKKGEVKEISVTGGSTTNEFTLHAYDYSPNHFFIDTVYASTAPEYNIFNRYYGRPTPDQDLYHTVKEIEVWKSVNTQQRNSAVERNAIAFINLPSKGKADLRYDEQRKDTNNIVAGQMENSRWVKLNEGQDYEMHYETGFITFKTQIQDQDAIAVAYRIDGLTTDPKDDLYYGELIGSDTSSTNSAKRLVLKLIKPQNLSPQFKTAWKLQLRNIYPVGGRNVNEEGFQFDIVYQQPGSEPQSQIVSNGNTVKLLHDFGLDNVNTSKQGDPDGLFDFFPGKTIIPSTGEVIFPVLQPFGRDLPKSLDTTYSYKAIYDTTVTFAKLQGTRDRFLLKGKYSASSSAVYNLGYVGVVENSVRVTLDGQELKAGEDYVVDYMTGQVTIRKAAALVPGAGLKITYEQNDLFQMASKTLLGLRGEVNFSKNTKLGFSALNLNQQTLSDKVRIGEEPLSNSIYGVDFSSAIDLPFVTKALDKVFSTREMSALNLKGEFAYISPDPNTKKSTIASDQSQSIAYVDDFEGAKKTIPIGVGYTSWHDLSIPDSMQVIADSANARMNHKGKSWWYNFLPSNVTVDQIWPQKKVARGDEQVTVLDFQFDPGRRGTYNDTPDLGIKERSWGGMMKALSNTANNLIEENIQFIEFWYQLPDNITPLSSKVYLDLGRISEDVIPNQALDTEDKNNNSLIDQGEDKGIDGKSDPEEPGYDPVKNPDPAGDDYSYTPGSSDYENINGTEGNAVSIDAGKLPDTEDLNGNGNLDRMNSYFRYEIPLDTNRANNKFITGGGNTDKHWHQIRVPLKEYVSKIGDPSFAIINYIRLWVNGTSVPVHFRIADFNLVGNQWQKIDPVVNGKTDINDSTLTLSVVSVEENSPEYQSPGGVERERDRSKPDENVLRNEQSLSLIIKDLKKGDERQAVKYLRAMDLFNYKQMKLFVHGDQNTGTGSVSNFINDSSYASEVYFRFGSDTANYYEYRQPVKAGWNEISILFEQLTALKQLRDSVKGAFQRPVPGEPGHFYRVKGNPTLTGVSFFMIGVANPGRNGNNDNVSGQVWIDELRVIGADDTKGWAYSSSASLKLADIMNINFNMAQKDPFFHGLSDRFGSRLDTKNWGVSVDLDVLKLLPFNLSGSSFRVNYQRTEQISKPLYVPGTDIKVNQAAQQLSDKRIQEGTSPEDAKKLADDFIANTHTLNISDTWSMSGMKIHVPSNFWLVKETINNLSFSFNYNKTRGRNPVSVTSRSWVWNAGVNYALQFGQNNFFYPADIPVLGTILQLFSDYRNAKVYYTPQSFSASVSATRNYGFLLSRVANTAPNISRDFKATRNAAFNWKLTEGGLLNLSLAYNLDISSSLAYLLTDNNMERSEGAIWWDIFKGQFFGRDWQYNQSVDLRTNPKLPNIWNLNNYFNISTGYRVSYSWNNNFQQQDLGRSASFNNSINLGLKIRVKALFEPMFKETNDENAKQENKPTTTMTPSKNRRTRERSSDEDQIPPQGQTNQNPVQNLPQNQLAKGDSVAMKDSNAVAFAKDSLEIKPKKNPFKGVFKAFKGGIRYILFDYESVNVNYTQDNTVQKSGIRAEGTGLYNFWGFNQYNGNGPRRLFMLGLSQDVGPRALKANLGDNFSQRNNLDFSTSRPLWEGAQIDIKWKIGWSMNKNTTLQTDSLGNTKIVNLTSTGSINRSFVSLPPVFFLSFLNSGIKRVSELYKPGTNNLPDAFLEGFESMPLFAKLPFLKDVAKYIPRPNWSFNWDGLEKYAVFSSWAKKVSLNHSYGSEYSEGWRINPDGRQETQSQKLYYGFQPLVGLNMTFNSLWNGNLSGNVKYSTKTGYDLGNSTKSITETNSKEIGISASYSKTGFDLPIFGLSLKNDIEITLAYTRSQNSVVNYNMDKFTEGGIPQDGTVRTTMEPRIKYVISSKVTLSIFYKRSSVQPEGAARISATTTNEAGLDVHISIQ
ncbi:MAG: cell surface protein SprA [Ignavibacteria bacterium]|nr:cell surface protein SprA [Ignavibacteria bacterium]MCU7500957.1 cell surface protein SprA [Ignavibacteria bacterium]MCU7511339.1 cell surface protein SprA [Ignavibacteria bacterium]MCU7519312.1 cell surface protein SprA [Ignavibacteria bacterium]MCU7523446.1 cell surface protein SprA [Ignavibacteria bacterium]